MSADGTRAHVSQPAPSCGDTLLLLSRARGVPRSRPEAEHACPAHRERCHLRMVKKAGPNKGRQFYTCPRAEGPAGQRESNCGYFQWQSDRIAQLKRKAASEAKA